MSVYNMQEYSGICKGNRKSNQNEYLNKFIQMDCKKFKKMCALKFIIYITNIQKILMIINTLKSTRA